MDLKKLMVSGACVALLFGWSAWATGTADEGGGDTGAAAMAGSGKYNESPMLAALVASGDLPPVDERLPEVPLVKVPPEIGRYGGTAINLRARLVGGRDRRLVARFVHPGGGRELAGGARRRQGLRTLGRPADLHPVPARGDEVVGWAPGHRRGLPVPLRGAPAARLSQRADRVDGGGRRLYRPDQPEQAVSAHRHQHGQRERRRLEPVAAETLPEALARRLQRRRPPTSPRTRASRPGSRR